MTTATPNHHIPHVEAIHSGDWAWLGATADSTADRFYVSAAEDWLGAVNSRYVDEMLDDTLPEKVLKFYLIQDFKFFNAGLMDHIIELAPRQETKDMLLRQQEFFASEEAPYFREFLKAYSVTDEEYERTPQTPANKEYCDELARLRDSDSFGETITALCCMEWVYLGWAKRTVDAGVTQQVPAHKGWVDLHEGEGFRRWVGDLIALVNEYADPNPDGPDARVFRNVTRLERLFFEQSYDMA